MSKRAKTSTQARKRGPAEHRCADHGKLCRIVEGPLAECPVTDTDGADDSELRQTVYWLEGACAGCGRAHTTFYDYFDTPAEAEAARQREQAIYDDSAGLDRLFDALGLPENLWNGWMYPIAGPDRGERIGEAAE